MKNSILVLSTLLIVITTAFAQKASEYYLPLSVGNHISLYSPGNSGYWARTGVNTIDGIDTIGGKIYYREVGREIGSGIGYSFNNIFRVLWLRADSVGNIIVGAYGEKDSTNIDSATVINLNWFMNQYLTKGYSKTYDYVALMGQFVKDSVISVSETVIVPAGTFNNCIKIKESTINTKNSIVRVEYLYYAKGIGLVKSVVAMSPDNGSYTFELTSFNTTGIDDFVVNQTPGKFSLSQNYPNPFNPVTTINYQLPTNSHVTLKVYDVLGKEVAKLVNEVKEEGSYFAAFDGSKLSSGIYFARLQSDNKIQLKKMVLIK